MFEESKLANNQWSGWSDTPESMATPGIDPDSEKNIAMLNPIRISSRATNSDLIFRWSPVELPILNGTEWHWNIVLDSEDRAKLHDFRTANFKCSIPALSTLIGVLLME
jgi:hypothetical protein